MPTPVYLTINEFPGTGAAAPTVVDFNFAGGYISPAHVKAEIFNPVTYLRTPVTVTDDNFVTDYRLSLPVVVPTGSILRVYRDTPKDQPLVNFTNGARIAENNLDLVARQAVFVAAESTDQIEATQVADVLQAVEAAALSAAQAQVEAGAAATSATLSQAAAQEGASIAGGFALAAAASATASSAAASASAAEASAVRADLAIPASGKGAEMVAFKQAGSNSVGRTVADLLDESRSAKGAGAAGDGATDDTTALKNMIADVTERDQLFFPRAINYKITDTLTFESKAGSVLDFGNQQINAASFTGVAKPAIRFKTMSESRIQDIFLIGNTTSVSEGVSFAASSGAISIHMVVDKIRVANCQTGVQVGSPTYQVSDSYFREIYASDCNVGVRFTGENTLAMLYGRVSAYNNTTIGLHIEEGGGSIESLQLAASGADLFVGKTTGLDHGKLARWDILSGYSEEGVNGERFIDSALCADTNPFNEEVVIQGFRVTPFTSTNVEDFIRWRLNGDLILKNVTVTHGQQLPVISVDHNLSYRAPTVRFDGVIDCNPKGAGPQLPMAYRLTDPRQHVEIDARVNNGMTFWQNNGAPQEGTIQRGIYTSKLKYFERTLLAISNLRGAWSLRDITSGKCRNLIVGAPELTASAPLERRDFWLDDGLIGFFRNATTSKTVSTTDAVYSSRPEYTFGAILRCVSAAGSAEENTTALGGASGMRIAVNAIGGGSMLCLVGGVNAFAAPTNPYDPHLVIGRYVSATSVKVDGINLRTGEIVSGTNSSAIPANGSLSWSNGVSIRNDNCVRGMPFLYSRAITDGEVLQIMQSALLLTESWKN